MFSTVALKRNLLVLMIFSFFVLPSFESLAAERSSPLVVVTIKPLHSLVTSVMKGVGSPHLLLKGATNPHSFQLKPSSARLINRAQLIVRVGANLEVSLNKTFASLGDPHRVLDLIHLDGLQLYPLRGRKGHKGHNGHHFNETHQDHKKLEHEVHEDEALEAEAHGDKSHDHGENHKAVQRKLTLENINDTDPHFWLDLDNAKIMVLAIASRLKDIDPQNGETYMANARHVISEIEQYKVGFDEALKPLSGRGFMVFHDAYQYLTRPHGFQFMGALRLHPSQPPSAKHLKALRADMERLDIACVFSEPQYNARVLVALTKNTNVKSRVLDPIGINIKAGESAYLDLMKQLSRQLLECLKRV